MTVEDYQKSMTEVTCSFQSLSKQMIDLSNIFKEHRLSEPASIIDDIQIKEKEKLQLTVQWQVIQTEQKETAEAEGKDEDDDFGESVVKQKALRQKLVDLALV